MALEECKLSLEHRKKLLGIINDTDYDTIHEIQDMIARSTCNMGVIFYRLAQYEKSIEMHKEALKIFIKVKDKDREFRTKEYIVGSCIKLWQANGNDLNFEDFSRCKDYLEELKNRFGDIDSLKEYENMIKIMEESF